MKNEILIRNQSYTEKVLGDFEKILGKLPVGFNYLHSNYLTGYPCFNTSVDTEVFYFSRIKEKKILVEKIFTLVECFDLVFQFDRVYGLFANHRKFGLLPLCASGSSYLVYFLSRTTNKVYALNPNQDIDVEMTSSEFEDRFMICDSIAEYFEAFFFE